MGENFGGKNFLGEIFLGETFLTPTLPEEGGDPVLESMRAREPGLQAPSNLAGSKIKNTHVFFPQEFFLRDTISNIGESICHVSCIHSEGKATKPTLYLKFSAK